MATLSHTKSRRLYSWWWDSHISPKNSKWLHENLTDMDSKVKSMIKIIEEDADSFRKRAEMYYRKRPELLKLVEEFYRAYRALAERYDNATGALRVAQKTISEAFPDQIPFLPDESPAEFSLLEFEKDGVYSDENDSVVSATGEIFAHDDGHEEVETLKDSISKLESENEALHNQCKNLNDEMLAGMAKLESVEHQCEQLQKDNLAQQMEIEKLNKENHSLNDEIKLLEESKVKLENELGIHVVDKKSLQQEIWYLKAERRNLEQRHYELKDQIGLVNLNVESLQEMVKELTEGTVELKELCKKHEDERSLHLENLKFVEKVTEQNMVLQDSLTTANVELEILREKIRILEENCDYLCSKISIHVSEKSVLVSQIEAIATNMEKLLEKNYLLENSLSDAHFELEDLRGKIKLVEESCQLFCDENSSLLDEKNSLLAQVQNISQNLETLEGRYAELQIKNLDLEKEKDHLIHQVQAVQNSFMLEKEEHNAVRESSQKQLATLEDQMEVEYQTIVKFEVENFILLQNLHDMKENNTLLLNKCRKYMEIFRFQEQLISELKHEIHVQKKMLKWVSQYNEKLVESTHQVMKALNIDNESKSMDDIEFKLILAGIEKLKDSVLDAQDENQLLFLEKEVIQTLFEQEVKSRFKELSVLQSEKKYLLEAKEQREEVLNIQMEMLHKKLSELHKAHSILQSSTSNLLNENQLLFLEKAVIQTLFEQEVKSRFKELSVLQSEKKYLLEAKEQREEVLNIQIEMLHKKLSELHEAHSILQSETSNLLNENLSFSKRVNELTVENKMLEENNGSLEAANLYFEYMYLIYKSYTEEAKEARDELEKNNLMLLENNTHITNDLSILHQINDRLLGEDEEHKMRESHLASELEYATQEIRSLRNENHIITINAAIFEEKMLELLMMCENLKVTSIVETEMLYEEIRILNSNEEKYKCELETLYGENRLLKEELSTYMPLVVSLSNLIASLEGRILSLADHHSTSDHEKMKNTNFQEGNEGHQATVKSGVFELQNLQSRIKMLEEIVISIQSRLEDHEFVPRSKSNDATTENEGLICKDLILHPSNRMETDNYCSNNADTGKFEPLMKDIQLDHVLISSIYERGSSSYSSSAIGSDEVKDIWGDKITEYDHEWSENITERLSSDAQRISSVQTNAKGLIESIETYEMSNKLVDFELEKVKAQLKEVEKAINLEIDINNKLRKKAEQNDEMGKVHGKKIMLQIQKRSGKIGKLELELQKAEYVWLKLKEENDYKKARDADRRTKVLLRDYFYGTRESIRRKKVYCCACIKPRTDD